MNQRGRRIRGGRFQRNPTSRAVSVRLDGAAAAETVCSDPAETKKVRVCVVRSGKPGPTISGPDDVCRLLRGAEAADRESFYAIHVDSKTRVVGVEEVHKGSIASVELHPREIFKSAIVSNAHAIVVAHNHPSGSAEPSKEDLDVTRRLRDAGALLGIPVLDHVVVAVDGCTSLRVRGHFDEAPVVKGKRGKR